ncbi:MAG: 2-C-methyl-D-erythritol 2,4-cyclodiphosphate synthase [bacterium]|nr:2-C-methyl-D-erythritol 2,4-cyclodiphosphate synthase [bacterium]
MNHAIILAAGQGQRMKARKDKLLMEAGGNPVIYYSLASYNDHSDIDNVIIVANEINKKQIETIISFYGFNKVSKVITGGLTRQESMKMGLNELKKTADKNDVILVHNAANPLPSHQEISETIQHTAEYGACIVGHFINSTVKEINEDHIIKTHDREKMFLAQTPQAAKFSVFEKAAKNAEKKKLEVTDEAMLLEAIGQPVRYVEAHENNFKITTEADHIRLKSILGDLPSDVRVGIGQDSHVFEEKKKGLVLGGIEFPDELKLEANSDGDVVLHAIFNALSQAIGDNSIGFYYDEVQGQTIYKSKEFLKPLLQKIKKSKFRINSIGVMIECKTPKIDPLVSKLKKSIATILGVDTRKVGITATSGEELTAFGAGLGIQCFAIVSLMKE